MIKILFFIETLEGGGAEKVLRNLVNNMDQTKFDITVQTVWPCDFEKYLVKEIKYKSMYSERNLINSMRYRFEAETGFAYKLHIKDNYDIECAYLECGPTKVLSHSTNPKAVKIAWVHCDLPKMYSKVPGYESKLIKQYEKFDKVVCVSEGVKTAFVDACGELLDPKVIYNVAESDEIITKSKEPLPDNLIKQKLTAVSIGRLTYAKSYDRLLRVYKRLRDDGIDFELWIAGEGEERATLEKIIEETGISDSVKLLGYCENPYQIIQCADLVICSSLYEGFSTSATEAIILGKPFVTTECPGMRELLGDSEYGLITENDENALYEGVKKMLTDVAIREKYANNAAERGKDLSTEKMVESNENFFFEVLNDGKS